MIWSTNQHGLKTLQGFTEFSVLIVFNKRNLPGIKRHYKPIE